MSGLWEELSWRGLVHQVTDPDLAKRLDSESLVVYLGVDPTADSLHIGHLLGICTLRRLQEAGHRPIAVAGGATGAIGDPGGRSDERNLLSAEELAANLVGIRAQLENFLDFDDAPGRPGAVMVDNAEWLAPMGLLHFLRDVGKHFTVNRMVAKDSVRNRFEAEGEGISYTEFSYMLLQAYDFLHLFDTLGCRLQVGGSDQWGNITEGIDLIRRVRSADAWGLTWPLVLRADGTKMGKTATGAVWLDPVRTSPYSLYQFLLRSEDAMVGTYLRFFSWLDRGAIEELDRATAEHPERRQAQQALAMAVTTFVHGAGAAAAAESASRALFGGDLAGLGEDTLVEVLAEAPSSTRSRAILEPPGWELVDALAACGLASSRSEARRVLAEGGVAVNNQAVSDSGRHLSFADLLHDRYLVLRRGKRNYHLARFE